MISSLGVQDYTHLAADYDRIRYLQPHQRFQEELRRESLLEMLRLEPHMEVADVATGTGRGAVCMAPYVKRVTGIDGTEAMLARARDSANRMGLTNIDFVVGDAFQLDFPDETFDRVISLNFLHLFLPVDRQARLVKEMARILKPGGLLLVELDNAFHGGPLGVIRKYFIRDIGYNWPWDVKRIFAPSGMRVEAIAGTNIPGLWRLWGTAPGFVKWFERKTTYGLLRNLKQRFQVLARKSG